MINSEITARIETALRANSHALRGYVRARAPLSDVDDILQIAAMRAVEKASTLRDADRIVPWLYSIHHTVIIDSGRKTMRERRLTDALAEEQSLFPVTSEATTGPQCDCILSQARQLKSTYASILDLVDISGASLKEAARSLGITVNAATVRLHRARAALKRHVLDHCGVTSVRECGDCRCTDDGCCAA
ncbi:MAG: sigma factor-like helix-turn-helix DNA-binding protein [Pseudomonadota bacterium]